jgi:hypothetical protein
LVYVATTHGFLYHINITDLHPLTTPPYLIPFPSLIWQHSPKK